MTLREHLKAIERLTVVYDTDDWATRVENSRQAWHHAVAALKALDEADRYAGSEGPYRLVPDPAPPTENTQPIRSDPAATTTTKKGTTA